MFNVDFISDVVLIFKIVKMQWIDLYDLRPIYANPIYACVSGNALCFGNTYVGSFMPMETSLITTKTQFNA